MLCLSVPYKLMYTDLISCIILIFRNGRNVIKTDKEEKAKCEEKEELWASDFRGMRIPYFVKHICDLFSLLYIHSVWIDKMYLTITLKILYLDFSTFRYDRNSVIHISIHESWHCTWTCTYEWNKHEQESVYDSVSWERWRKFTSSLSHSSIHVALLTLCNGT